ncbi:MAG: CAP domain-containing protein [Gemmatimonadaceae bacterium]
MLAGLNVARTNPTAMAGQLQQLEAYFTGTRFKRPSWAIAVQTVEGVGAVREAVRAVRGQRPVAALTRNASLTRAARDHAVDHARTGNTGHTGSDGSNTATRVARYGTWQISLSENIDFAPMVHGRDVIESLLIDDGVRDRGHRRNIYEPSARLVGIACGPHPKFTATCVIVQAGGIIPK